MIGKFKQLSRYEYLILTLVLAIFYASIIFPFGYFRYLDKLMFWMPDAQSYRSVADWILGAKDSVNPLIRPVLYPLILVAARSVANNNRIWGLQFLLWMISGLLIYRVIKSTTSETYLAFGGVLLYMGNLTLLLLTLHALTEVTAIFLATILICIILNKKMADNKYYWPLILFLVSLLTITKPVFIPLLIILLVYLVPMLISSMIKHRNEREYPAYFILALLPVLVQIVLMKVSFNEITISNIGATTIKTYYLARVYGVINSVSLNQARQAIDTWNQSQSAAFIFTHIGQGLRVFIKTILENILSRSDYINIPNPNLYLFIYMRLVNILYFVLHTAMVIPTILVLRKLYRQKLWIEFEQIIFLLVPIVVIFLTSGITFAQGDRIILPALPFWIVMYAMILSRYRKLRSEELQRRN